MKNLGWYNGKYDLIENMTVPMNDRVSYFGDGVYDVTYCRNYKPYCLDLHLDRFFSSAAKLRIEIPVSREELAALLCDLVKKLDSPDQIMYWQVTRGTATRSHEFPVGVKANLWVILRPAKLNPMDKLKKLVTVEDTRFYHCDIKTLNLIPNVMGEQKAKEAGCDTGVFVRPEGNRVTECCHANIHIMNGGKIITPPTDNLILPGIARLNIIRIAGVLGIPVEIRPFTKDEMMNADEIFLSSSGSLCMRVGEIDGKQVGQRDGATIKKLQDALLKDFLDATD